MFRRQSVFSFEFLEIYTGCNIWTKFKKKFSDQSVICKSILLYKRFPQNYWKYQKMKMTLNKQNETFFISYESVSIIKVVLCLILNLNFKIAESKKNWT